jgi:hypothetical protein
MSARHKSLRVDPTPHVHPSLPALRFEVPEAAQILRMSRAQLYNRIGEGALQAQKDGARTYISLVELERYVACCGTSRLQREA